MQYRTDPQTGLQLSALGFGCMRFPKGITAQPDLEKAEALVRAAVESGVNYFDTAYVYGGSEAVLGKIFARNPGLREKLHLATKLPYRQVKKYEDFDRLLHIQLERLQTDHIDYYLIHNLTTPGDWQGLAKRGAERWIAEKKESGQIRQIGFSYHGNQGDFAALLEAYPWQFVQIQYNYSDENYQAGRAGLQRAAAMGLPVIIMEPLLGGKLANGLPKEALRLFGETGPKPAEQALRSPAEWALRWLWDQPQCTVVLSGMNSMAQLEENVRVAGEATSGCLTEEEHALYPRVVASFREAFKVPCTGCSYCMPCPKGVNIPGCLGAYNARYALGYIAGVSQYFTSTNVVDQKNNSSAHKCVACGACVQKCPQHIDIPGQLGKVGRMMEPWPLRMGLKLYGKLQK